jgi:hypothetical protein
MNYAMRAFFGGLDKEHVDETSASVHDGTLTETGHT